MYILSILLEIFEIELFTLLNIFKASDDPGLIARPIIEIEFDEEKIFVPFDVLAYFDTFEEAKAYAEKNDLAVSIIAEE